MRYDNFLLWSKLQCMQIDNCCSMVSVTYKKLNHTRVIQLFQFVDTSGATLNQLKQYLVGFWQYYNSSPTIQKALERA